MIEVLRPSGAEVAQGLRAVASALSVATGPTAVVAPDLVIADAALAQITADPFAGTAMLVRPSTQGDTRVRHHVVNSVGSAFHRVMAPDHVFVGALVIAARDAKSVGAAINATAAAFESGAFESGEIGSSEHD
ncbi:MAG: hypothetical protein ACOYO9_04850, partial [Candidatus Nanopelagicales bacterium]